MKFNSLKKINSNNQEINSCDFVIFYEHVDREYEISQILKTILSKISNKKGIVLSIIFQRHLLLRFRPKLIIYPSLSWVEINKICYIYRGGVDIVSLNYEQMLSDFNERSKTPQGEFLKNKVLHFAWTEKYRKYLYKNGVSIDNIEVVNKYVYQLMREKLSSGDKKNNQLKSKYNKIVFVPLTDLQAFKNNERIKKEFAKGVLFEDALKRRDFVFESIKIILTWIYSYAKNYPCTCFIIRPHPSVGLENYKLLRVQMGFPDLKNIIYNYEGSAIDFFETSNVLVTNYSSLILDANFCGLKGIILEPLSFPEYLKYEWFDDFDRITNYDDFEKKLTEISNGNGMKLLSSEFLEKSNGIYNAASKIYKWSAEFNQPYEKLNRIDFSFLLNFNLLKLLLGSVVRLAFLRYFRFGLKEGLLRDGIKVIND
jgi:hypothetical protein